MTRISVIGLGAMGAAHAARITDAWPQAELRVVADGRRADRLRTAPVLVNGKPYRFAVCEPSQPVEPADLVIVTVKDHHLPTAIRDIAGHVGESTIILSLLNGISSERVLAAAYPLAAIPLAVSVGIDAVRQPSGDVHFTSLGRVEFGGPVIGGDDSLDRLSTYLTQAGIPWVRPADMERALWWKWLVNVGANQVSALLEAPYAVLQRPGPARELMLAAQREVIAVAQAEGVDLRASDTDTWLDVLAGLGPENYTSMAQDALAHRRTEVDIFAGAVVDLGGRNGVATPVNWMLLQTFLARQELWGVSD